MPKDMLRISQFQSINVDVDEALMETYELVKADNAEIIDNGKLAKAQGSEFVNQTSLAGKVIQMFEWARDDGTVLRFARVYSDNSGFGSVSLVRVLDDGTAETIYNESVERKTNFAVTFTEGYEMPPDLTICGVMQVTQRKNSFELPSNNCKNIIYDSSAYLYAGLLINEARIDIVKIDLSNMAVVGRCVLTSYDEFDLRVIAMAYDGTYIYMAYSEKGPVLGCGYPRIRRINAATMTFISEIEITEGIQRSWEYSLLALKFIDGYLYLFGNCVHKINATTFAVEKSSAQLYGKSYPYYCFSDAAHDDEYFYVTFNDSPAMVFKIDRENLEVKSTITMPSGYNGCYAAAYHDKYLYLGTDTAPGKIVKVNLDLMQIVNYTSLVNGINYCRDIVYDETNDVLYVAMDTSPGKLLVVNPSTLDVINTLTLPSGQNSCNALSLINGKLYIGLGTSPAQILVYNVTITYDSDFTAVDTKDKKIGTFSLLDTLYLLTGTNYLQYDGDATIEEVKEQTEDEEGNEVTDCDLDPIRGCTMAIWHPTSFRVFFAGDGSNKLYYSEKNDPRWVKKAGYVVPTTGDGPITGLALFMDAVVVFFQRSAWVWNGQDPASDATWKRLPLTEGTESPATIECGTNQLEWLGTGSGYWAMAPAMIGATTVVNPAQSLLANLAEKKVTNYLKNVKNRGLACGAYDTRERKSYIAFCDDSSLSCCNKMLIRNTDIPGSFTLLTGQQIYDLLYTSNGELWIATENYIVKRYEHYKQALPDGTYGAIAMDILTPASVLKNPYRQKWVHSLSVGFLNPGAGFELTITLYVDGTTAFTTTYTATDDDGDYIMARFTDIYDAIGTRFAVGITNNQAATKAVIYEIALQYSLVSNYGQSI
jgi:hypothetical protein